MACFTCEISHRLEENNSIIGKYVSKPHLENLSFSCKKLLPERVHILEITLLILIVILSLWTGDYSYDLTDGNGIV